jgi:hypothetical protein
MRIVHTIGWIKLGKADQNYLTFKPGRKKKIKMYVCAGIKFTLTSYKPAIAT